MTSVGADGTCHPKERTIDLLLIDPPRRYWGFGGGLGFYSPPVGLAALAGYLQSQGVLVDILDCNGLEIGWEQLPVEIVQRRPRCVGVSSSMTCFVPQAFRCLELVKQLDPNIHTLGGGAQFTLAPQESLDRCHHLDYVVRGDGEETTLELLGELRRRQPKLAQIRGLSYRSGSAVTHNEERPALADLDALPLPAWHMLPMADYALPVIPPVWGNYSIVVTSRGCPYSCSFCSPRLAHAPYRAMSAERVLAMLDQLYHTYGTRVFWFSDLSFNVDRRRTEHILDGIIARNWKVHIALDGTRTDLIVRDQHLLPKMKKAGVFLVCLGVESPHEETLQRYNKGTGRRQAMEAMDLIKRHGIHPWCFFMLGDVGQNASHFRETLDYARRLDPTIAIFTLLTPVPGTVLYEKMLSQDRVQETDWGLYDFGHPILRLDELTHQQVLDLYEECFKGFYSRASKIIRHGVFGDDFARYTYRFLRFVNSARQIKEGLL